MKRRQFALAATASTVSLGLGAGLGMGMLVGTSALAQPTQAKPGTDYLVLDKPVAVDAAKGKVEVIEFFGYWCHIATLLNLNWKRG